MNVVCAGSSSPFNLGNEKRAQGNAQRVSDVHDGARLETVGSE